jgi:uncharacterized protein YcbK (DUF882 family)
MQLSEHFRSEEFACKCCGTLPPSGIDETLIECLEMLRFLIGSPLRIVSGYRCPEYNKKVGGARRSKHLLGYAADVQVAGTTADRSVTLISKHADKITEFNRGGIGLYKTFVHLDVRGKHGQKKARWQG